MKRIYATMAGDLFHRGHLEFIKKARKLGDYLIIGLHPDDVIKKYKREPIISYSDRKAIIEAINGVDLVIKDCMDFRKPTMFDNLRHYKPDILVHAGKWMPPLYIKAEEMGYKIIRESYYKKISTSIILRRISGKKLQNYIRQEKNYS